MAGELGRAWVEITLAAVDVDEVEALGHVRWKCSGDEFAQALKVGGDAVDRGAHGLFPLGG
jgi:hypothetical protein